MEEADFLCNRIGIIDKGKIIALDSPSGLKESLGGEIIEIELKNKGVGTKDTVESILKPYNFVHKVELNDKEENLVIYVDDASSNLPVILKAIDNSGRSHNNSVKSVDFRSPTLSDVFLKFTGRNITHSQQQEDHAEGGFMERYAQYENK